MGVLVPLLLLVFYRENTALSSESSRLREGHQSSGSKLIVYYLIPGDWLETREFLVFSKIVLGVHLLNLVATRSSQNTDNLKQLINLGISQKRCLSIDHLNNHTTCWPHIDLGSILCGPKYKLWSSIASWTNVSNIRFTFY